MSSPQPPTSPTERLPFSNDAFSELVQRVRRANANCSDLAYQHRRRISLARTHHAKRHASMVGLRIDTAKARACPSRHVSTIPPPVIDHSESPTVDAPAPASAVDATTVDAVEEREHDHEEDVDVCGPPLRNLPEVVVRRKDERQRVVLRLPPLRIHVDVRCGYEASGSQAEGSRASVPDAPRLRPTQLPDDDSGMQQPLGSSSTDESEPLATPPEQCEVDFWQVYTGLCITIPPRSSKRKRQGVEDDGEDTPSQLPKRLMRSRWNQSQRR